MMHSDGSRSTTPILFSPLDSDPDPEEIHQEQLRRVIYAQEFYHRRSSFPEAEQLHRLYVDEHNRWLAEDEARETAAASAVHLEGLRANPGAFSSFCTSSGGVYCPGPRHAGLGSPADSYKSQAQAPSAHIPLRVPQFDGSHAITPTPKQKAPQNPLSAYNCTLSQKIYNQALWEYASEPQNYTFHPRTNGGHESQTESSTSVASPLLPIIASFPLLLGGGPSNEPRDFLGGEILRVLAHKRFESTGEFLYCILWRSNEPAMPVKSWWVQLNDIVDQKNFIDEYHLRNRLGPIPWPSSGKKGRLKSSASLGVKEIKNALEERRAQLIEMGYYGDDAGKEVMDERWKMRDRWQRLGRSWGTAKQVVQACKAIWREQDAASLLAKQSRAKSKGKEPESLARENLKALETPATTGYGILKHRSESALRLQVPVGQELTGDEIETIRTGRQTSAAGNAPHTIGRAKYDAHDHKEWRRHFGSAGAGSTVKHNIEASSSSNSATDSEEDSMIGYSETTIAMLKRKPKKRNPSEFSRVRTNIMAPKNTPRMKSKSRIPFLDGTGSRTSMDSNANSISSVGSTASAPQKRQKNPTAGRNILVRLFGTQHKEPTDGRRTAFYTAEEADEQRYSQECFSKFWSPPNAPRSYGSRPHLSMQLPLGTLGMFEEETTKTPYNSISNCGVNTPDKQSKGFNLSGFMAVFDGSKSTYAQREMNNTQPKNPRNSKEPNGTTTDSRASHEGEDIEGERGSRMWLDGADDDFDADEFDAAEYAFTRSQDYLSEELLEELGDGDSYRDRPIVTSPGQLDGSNSSSVQPTKASPSELYQSCIDNLDYIESASMVSNTTAASSARSGTSDQFAAGPNDDDLYTLRYYVGPPLPRFLETTCNCRLPLVCSEHLEDWRTYLTTRPDSPLSGWTVFYRRIRDRHRRERKRVLDFLRMKSNSYRHLRRSIADIQTGALTIEELSPQEYEILMKEKFEAIQYQSFMNDAQLQESEIMQEKKARVYEQTKRLQELMLKARELGKGKLGQDEKAELRYLQRRCAKRRRLEWNNGYEVARIHARQGKLVLD